MFARPPVFWRLLGVFLCACTGGTPGQSVTGGNAHEGDGGDAGSATGGGGIPGNAGSIGTGSGGDAGVDSGGSGAVGGSTGGNPGGAGGAAGAMAGGAGGAGGMLGAVPLFIATGRGGRRLTSCDDGRTWLSTCTTQGFPAGACKINDSDGDHEEWSSHNVAHGNGVFLALYGWFGGDSAHVLRTRDGRAWEHVFGAPGTAKGTWGSGIAFGNGVFAVNAQRNGTHRTTNSGNTWTSTEFVNTDRPHRRSMLFIPYLTGRFISFGDGGRFTYSDDDGVKWTDTSTVCAHLGSFAWGADVLVAKDNEGICASRDGGKTWTVTARFTGSGQILWTGTEFFISQAYTSTAHRSADGVAWRNEMISSGNAGGWPEVLAISAAGTMVGVNSNGDAFFRSSNGGKAWTKVPAPVGTGITDVVFGHGSASADCPAP